VRKGMIIGLSVYTEMIQISHYRRVCPGGLRAGFLFSDMDRLNGQDLSPM